MKGTVMAALAGATRYEFVMQIRRKALWVTFLVFGLVLALSRLPLIPWAPGSEGLSVPLLVANWSFVLQMFYPIAFGILLADRLPRDGRTGVQELLDALPVSLRGRFLGKYLGATVATVVPLLLIYAAGIAYVAARHGDLSALPLALAAFATINLPGLFFVAAFSISCTAILWVPLYQFLFVGYWFWGNLVYLDAVGFPTLTGTILTPVGEYMANGFFGTEPSNPRVAGATVGEGIASMGLLLGLGALALLVGYRLLLWQRDRR